MHRHRHFTRRIHRAFTLVEVLVVVAILAIAGAIVTPALNSAGQLGAQGAARLLIADILIAQSEAVAAQEVRRVWFFPNDDNGRPLPNGYQLEDAAGRPLTQRIRGGSTGDYRVDFSADDRYRDVRIRDLQPADSSYISFDALGSPVDDAANRPSVTSFRLQSPGADYIVRIRPITGRVTVDAVGSTR